MTESLVKMQRAQNKSSKGDWRKQNFTNMVSIHQKELVQEGLKEIWGSHTGFSYTSGNSLHGLLEFVPPAESTLAPRSSNAFNFVSYDDFPVLDHFDQVDRYADSFSSTSGDRDPEVLSNEGSPKNMNIMPVHYPPLDFTMASYASNNGNMGPTGPHDTQFLKKYARILVPGSFVCQVQFKYATRDYSITEYLMSTQTIDVGTVLIVRSHVDIRQIDLGVVVRIMSVPEYVDYKSYLGKSLDADENFVGQVLRVAFKKDTKKLTLKHTTEATLLPIAQNLVNVHQLPIVVYGLEFQYDGFNLFVYFTRKSGVDHSDKLDFKPYIYDLIVDCPHTRIIMKDTTNSRPFAPDPMAEKKLKKL